MSVPTLCTYSDSPFAVPRCEKLEAPENGEILIPESPVSGDTATYKCDNGFELMGSEVVTCESNSEWSGVIPTCIGGEYYVTVVMRCFPMHMSYPTLSTC